MSTDRPLLLVFAALAVALFALAGCSYEGNIGQVSCETDDDCAQGFCDDGYCVQEADDPADAGHDAGPDADPCDPEDDDELCEINDLGCTTETVVDTCGDERTVDCTGDCPGLETCLTPEDDDNHCGCPDYDEQQICEAVDVECGTIDDPTDHCSGWDEFDDGIDCGQFDDFQCAADYEICLTPEDDDVDENTCGCPDIEDQQLCDEIGAECGTVENPGDYCQGWDDLDPVECADFEDFECTGDHEVCLTPGDDGVETNTCGCPDLTDSEICNEVGPECGTVSDPSELCPGWDDDEIDCDQFSGFGCDYDVQNCDQSDADDPRSQVCACKPVTDDQDICDAVGAECGTIQDPSQYCEDWDDDTVQCEDQCGDEVCTPQDNVCGCPCEVDGTCYAEGESPENNDCVYCDPDEDDESFTDRDDETVCDYEGTDDGKCVDGTCRECFGDGDCPETTDGPGVCDEDYTCLPCVEHGDCEGTDDADGACTEDNTCVDCLDDADCDAIDDGDGGCTGDNTCVECTEEDHCPGGCDNNSCVECTEDEHCNDYCDTDANQCEVCTEDDHCEGTDDADGACLVDDDPNQCVDCTDDTDCPEGDCDTDDNVCVPADDDCEPGQPAPGEGTDQDPYRLCGPDHLDDLEDSGEYFEIVDDIDMSTKNWDAIDFSGHLDGGDHSLDNFVLDQEGESEIAFFESLGGTVQNLSFDNTYVQGEDDVAVVAALLEDAGELDNVAADGAVDADGENVGGLVAVNDGGEITDSSASVDIAAGDADHVGGLVGDQEEGTIERSHATGTVNGNDRVGGLVGRLEEGSIHESYATGQVTGDDEIGGLIGRSESEVRDSYATGDVFGDSEVGGFIGNAHGGADTFESYAYGYADGETDVGGFVGDTTPGGGGDDIEACFWNASVSDSDPSSAVGLTEQPEDTQDDDHFENEARFSDDAGWDFTDTWIMLGDPAVRPGLQNNTEQID